MRGNTRARPSRFCRKLPVLKTPIRKIGPKLGRCSSTPPKRYVSEGPTSANGPTREPRAYSSRTPIAEALRSFTQPPGKLRLPEAGGRHFFELRRLSPPIPPENNEPPQRSSLFAPTKSKSTVRFDIQTGSTPDARSLPISLQVGVYVPLWIPHAIRTPQSICKKLASCHLSGAVAPMRLRRLVAHGLAAATTRGPAVGLGKMAGQRILTARPRSDPEPFFLDGGAIVAAFSPSNRNKKQASHPRKDQK